MTASPGLITTLFAFLLVLGPLVLIHELGHYLVGRLFGVKANAFSIGFGKELFGWTDRRGTRWKISAVPLGGYVQFAGDMNPASAAAADDSNLTPQERAETFHVKPLWQRALIVLAGPLTNLVLAILIFAAFSFAYGKIVADPIVYGFAETSDARDAGLRVQDRIVAVDGNNVETPYDIGQYVTPYPGRTVALAVDRDGRRIVIPVRLHDRTVRDQFGNEGRIADLGIDFAPAVIGHFAVDSPAHKAGLKIGDRLLAVDGKAVNGFAALAETIATMPGRTVAVTVARGDERLTVPVTLAAVPTVGPDGKPTTIGRLGVRNSRGLIEPVGVGEALQLGVTQSWSTMRMMGAGIGQIFSGERSVKELGGPIKIAKYSGEQFSLGWEEFVAFVGLISINLAFINLLPIPGLDGGHLAFYAAECIRRKPLGLRSQEWAIRTGVALVLALMLFVTVNDLVSLPIFGG
ncbi:RIP metalloprotease RseP [Novosphingobium colocasiae]|uniref:RIP metalloprotease RseP n=1 Tax=Novosphingobium colocasiae TaxID=1256513 RepID=UPI0035B3956C